MRLRSLLKIMFILIGLAALAVLVAVLLWTEYTSRVALQSAPTPTPRPTWTPTPTRGLPPSTPTYPSSPLPTPTYTPTWTPTPVPTWTPTYTPTSPPTDTPTPTPTPTPSYAFELEDFETFPARFLEEEGLRIFAYVYAPSEPALSGYSLLIRHDGIRQPVQAESTGGLPGLTRPEPSPYTRFTNLEVWLPGPPGGTWEIQLIDAEGRPAGPSVMLTLRKGDPNRDIYVRYRRR